MLSAKALNRLLLFYKTFVMNENYTNHAKYAIAFVPEDPVYSKVSQLKEYVSSNYRCQSDSLPQITLIKPFDWEENKEYLLVDSIKKFVTTQFPVDIDLTGFGINKDEKVYIKIENEDPIKKMQWNLRNHFDTSIRVGYSEADNYNPHVCFGCTDTSKASIKKAWEEFKNKYFEASFIGSKISLIKTTQAGYEIAAQFELE